MSYEAMNWVRNLRSIPYAYKNVLMMIAFHSQTDKGESCSPSIKQLSAECCACQKTVYKAIKWLTDKGCISKSKNGDSGRNVYTILFNRNNVSNIIDEERHQKKLRRKAACKYTSSHKTRAAIFERDGYFCSKCGSNKNLTLDHIIAVANGGKDKLSNLQVLCRSCNSKKRLK